MAQKVRDLIVLNDQAFFERVDFGVEGLAQGFGKPIEFAKRLSLFDNQFVFFAIEIGLLQQFNIASQDLFDFFNIIDMLLVRENTKSA